MLRSRWSQCSLQRSIRDRLALLSSWDCLIWNKLPIALSVSLVRWNCVWPLVSVYFVQTLTYRNSLSEHQFQRKENFFQSLLVQLRTGRSLDKRWGTSVRKERQFQRKKRFKSLGYMSRQGSHQAKDPCIIAITSFCWLETGMVHRCDVQAELAALHSKYLETLSISFF